MYAKDNDGFWNGDQKERYRQMNILPSFPGYKNYDGTVHVEFRGYDGLPNPDGNDYKKAMHQASEGKTGFGAEIEMEMLAYYIEDLCDEFVKAFYYYKDQYVWKSDSWMLDHLYKPESELDEDDIDWFNRHRFQWSDYKGRWMDWSDDNRVVQLLEAHRSEDESGDESEEEDSSNESEEEDSNTKRRRSDAAPAIREKRPRTQAVDDHGMSNLTLRF